VEFVEHHAGHVGQRLGLGSEQRVERFGRGQQQVGGAARVEGVAVARLHGQATRSVASGVASRWAMSAISARVGSR
jgi:tartrate dehydratase alpha subunit/fumarate hydratase class I-like protein